MVDTSVSAHRTLSSESRVAILELLEERGAPVPLTEVAAAVGLHVNTVREHLDRLVAGGFVGSEPEASHRRGRPRLLYRALETPAPVVPEVGASEHLKRALVLGYGRPMDCPAETAERDGRALGADLVRDAPPQGDQLGAFAEHLTALGFSPEVGSEGRTVCLGSCPVRDLARARPEVVCNLHLGLVRGVLAGLPGPWVVDRVETPEPGGRCVLHLADRAAVPSTHPAGSTSTTPVYMPIAHE
ncbi:helix-turn-helix domain-containing protein [Actinotalea sp. BY-33]|uniref:Helix-turn-helix domain-containing protein n=1 Tax=Actinotalea soli TaxID=2819234 RepID=A0A939LRV7_9CELL|nr:helix-turn-helix domain-containing protein [Actinotalea soli]MBO1750994.1 helix-turn-helix domain-containing protein [Actinotalea soli]